MTGQEKFCKVFFSKTPKQCVPNFWRNKQSPRYSYSFPVSFSFCTQICIEEKFSYDNIFRN